jgi:RecA-family ATPase
MHGPKISGNFDNDHDDDEPKHSRKWRIREKAREYSRYEVGNWDAVDEYLAKAEGEVKWEDLQTFMKKAGWVLETSFKYNGPDATLLYKCHRYVYSKYRKNKKFIISHEDNDGDIVFNAGPVRVPYNLQDLLKRPDDEINLVEGEKAVDLLKKKGLLATCIQGQVWTDDCAVWFSGRTVNVSMDNDDAGRKNTARALEWLAKGNASTVRVPLLPGLGSKCGLDDWIAEHSPKEYREIVAKTFPEIIGSNPVIIDPTSWENKPVPEREWIVEPLIPANNVSLLYGDGGLGKSLLSLQLAAARALKREWLGIKTTAGRTLVISAEDDGDEMHRRLFNITRCYGAKLAHLGNIKLVDLVGQDAVIGELSRSGKVVATELYKFMVSMIALFRPGLVIIDALADGFSGDENNRSQARQFISMLRGTGKNYGCAFLVLAHPSLSGINTERGTSGSTGWSNSVRSRMYFKSITDKDGKEVDTNIKNLIQPKANYSAGGFDMNVRYSEGFYMPIEGEINLSRMEKETIHENVFLAILKRYAEQDRYVSDQSSAAYAPSRFAEETEAKEKRIKNTQLKEAMNRLFEKNAIKVEEYGPSSRKRRRIVLNEAL